METGELQMIAGARYGHTNLIASDWRALSRFYQELFGCTPVPPVRDFKRLAGWGAILAIPTVIFSLYGMNFQWMPELQWKAGYPLAVAVTALGCVLVYRRLRRARWV